jgi:hypothetical protein
MANFKVKLSPPTQDFVLKNTTVNPQRLDKLTDISEPDGAKISGSILVYNASTDTYVLSDILTYDEESGAYKLDGGGEF